MKIQTAQEFNAAMLRLKEILRPYLEDPENSRPLSEELNNEVAELVRAGKGFWLEMQPGIEFLKFMNQYLDKFFSAIASTADQEVKN